jgi:poly(A) polymerase
MRESAQTTNRDDHARRLREAATSIVRELTNAGYEAYFAGGCVRDRLMGHEPEDYDIATSARPEQVKGVFPRAQAVGEAFGVMLVRRGGFTIEVATFRTDGRYSDYRRPDEVEFTDAEHDAMRRDFTINGLFEDPLNDRIIDYVGGQHDLEAHMIRAIGDPEARLHEDRLRMLRAVRFAARFAFAIDTATADAIRTGAGELEGVSRERIGIEVRKMLTDDNRAVAAWEMQYLGLDRIVLREENCMNAPTRLGRLVENTRYWTALAAWMLDRNEHVASDIAPSVQRWTEALMLSNAERDGLKRAIEVYAVLCDGWDRLGVAEQKRMAAASSFLDGLALLQTTDRTTFIEIKRRVVELSKSELAPTPLLTGEDLIEMGMTPGPSFRVILDAVYDAQLEGTIRTRKAAIDLATAIARDHLPPEQD